MSYIYQPTGLKQRKRPTLEQHQKMVEQLAAKPHVSTTVPASIDLPKPVVSQVKPLVAVKVKPEPVQKSGGGGWNVVAAGTEGGDAQGGWNVVQAEKEPQVLGCS